MSQDIIKKIKSIIDHHSLNENNSYDKFFQKGAQFYRERLKEVCEFTLSQFEGNILEIGACRGFQSIIFLEIAKKYNRKLIVIDPWNNTQDAGINEYNEYINNTKRYKDFLNTHILKSQSKQAIEIIQSNKFAFTLIDGLHTSEAVDSDITNSYHYSKVIAIDDISWCNDVKLIFNKYTNLGYNTYLNNRSREGYIFNIK